MSDDNDRQLQQRAAHFLDAETAAIDSRTRVALADARVRAAAGRRANWLRWGGGGLGVALAASLAVFVVLPRAGTGTAGNEAMTALLAGDDAALASTEEAALADDLAFVAWLEENHDPS